MQVLARPVKDRTEVSSMHGRHRSVDKLLLSAAAEPGEHESPTDSVRDSRPMVIPDDVQSEIKRSRASRRGQDVAAVDEQHVRANMDPRMPSNELVK